MTRVKQPRMLERDIERTCTEFLELDGWRALKTDPVSDRGRGKGFGERGMADVLYIRFRGTPCGEHAVAIALRLICGPQYAEVMWIEWKRIKGKAATKAHLRQQQWHASERARGALTLIAGEDFPASIEGFQTWYFQSGLARRVRPNGVQQRAQTEVVGG